MEWPHDPDGEEGSEGGRKYGIAILAKKVDDEDFPLVFDQFARRIHDHPVRINHDTVVSAGKILNSVPIREAEDKTEFNHAIGRAMRGAELWEYYPEEADV
jgi:hypothetical protein